MTDTFLYPKLRVGDEIEVAPNPDAQQSQWNLAQVAVIKNSSCDAVYIQLGGVSVYRHDCLHIDDPRVRATKDWAQGGRGVFRLTAAELERREMFWDRIPEIEKKLHRLESLKRTLERVAMGHKPVRKTVTA